MAAPGLLVFLLAVQVKTSLPPRLMGVRSLEELVSRAQEAGYAVTARELQLWAHHAAFDAPWWPWAGQGMDMRLAFFRGAILHAPRKKATRSLDAA